MHDELVKNYLQLVLVAAFTWGWLSRHHQLSWSRRVLRHFILDGPVWGHYRFRTSPFFIVRSQRLSRSGSRSALIVVAHVFGWPPVRLHHVRGGVGRSKSLISSPLGRLAARPNKRSLLWTEATPQFCLWYSISTSHVLDAVDAFIVKDRQHLFVRALVLATFGNRRAESIASLPDKPCPLYTTIFHVATKARIADEGMQNGQG